MLYFTDHQNDITNQLLFTMEHKLGSFKGKACLRSEKLRGRFRMLSTFLSNAPISYPWKDQETFGFRGYKRKNRKEMG